MRFSIFTRKEAIDLSEVQEQTEAMDVVYKPGLHGRMEITSSVESINQGNLVRVLSRAIAIHHRNSRQIDYLYNYMRGIQPVLGRVKKIRPEICNRVVENHASEAVQFTSGYVFGEPVTYVRRGDRLNTSAEINLLNDYMFYENGASHDKDLGTWLAICGVGYKMVLPDRELPDGEDRAPFELDIPDPRKTFVVYHSGFGHRRLMGVQEVWREADDGRFEVRYCGYTPTHYFEVLDGTQIKVWRPHTLGDIPIFEYRLNMARMGCFEAAIPVLDAINGILSDRMDALDQYVQSFLKFINCEVDEEAVDKLRKMGAIVIKSHNGMVADVQLISQELNQSQTQTLVDYLYDQFLVICGMPTTTKGGASTSDTGQAVFLRDGWSQCEARAKDTELLYKRSEKEFLRLVLRIIKSTRPFDLSLSEIEPKMTRRQHDNLLTKTQSLTQMLEAGIAPEVAIATCGLFNDPMDVTAQSKDYLKKWDVLPLVPEILPESDVPDGDEE